MLWKHSGRIKESAKMAIRSYTKLVALPTFKERFDYLLVSSSIGDVTFGGRRALNQQFYRSAEWKRIRDMVIVRDGGCDLAMEDRPIYGRVLIHHINPVTIADFEERSRLLFDPEFMVCVSFETHNALHYGSDATLLKDYAPRFQNDTCPWKNS